VSQPKGAVHYLHSVTSALISCNAYHVPVNPFRRLRSAAGRHREVGEPGAWRAGLAFASTIPGVTDWPAGEISRLFFLRNERHANVLARRSLTPARGTPGGLFEQIRQAKGSRRQVRRANPTGGAALGRSRTSERRRRFVQPLRADVRAKGEAIAKRCSVASSTRRSKAAWSGA
jgi:hypothetical protein